jgi:FkbM family methyltransferase
VNLFEEMTKLDSMDIKEGSVIYDIGACVGLVTLDLLKNYPRVVHAFEPSSFNFPILLENMKGHSNVVCHNVALHDREYICRTRFKDCKDDKDEEQDIEYVILEKYIERNGLPLPSFIKMDIEGMESIVLNTFDFLFTSVRPTIYVEFHCKPRGVKDQEYPDNPHWVWPENGGFDFNKLRQFNYRICKDIESGVVTEPFEDYNPTEGMWTGALLFPFDLE